MTHASATAGTSISASRSAVSPTVAPRAASPSSTSTSSRSASRWRRRRVAAATIAARPPAVTSSSPTHHRPVPSAEFQVPLTIAIATAAPAAIAVSPTPPRRATTSGASTNSGTNTTDPTTTSTSPSSTSRASAPGSSRCERRGRRPMRRVDGTIGSGGILSAAILSGSIARSQPTIQDRVRAARAPGRRAAPRPYSYGLLGGVAERSNAPVLKTGVRSRGPRVRIPPPPLARVRDTDFRCPCPVLPPVRKVENRPDQLTWPPGSGRQGVWPSPNPSSSSWKRTWMPAPT